MVMDELANSGIYYSCPAVAKPQRALTPGRDGEAYNSLGIVQLCPSHRHPFDTCYNVRYSREQKVMLWCIQQGRYSEGSCGGRFCQQSSSICMALHQAMRVLGGLGQSCTFTTPKNTQETDRVNPMVAQRPSHSLYLSVHYTHMVKVGTST